MVEIPESDKELRYRDVTIYSQGKTEHGTLHLLKHHACFSYLPGTKNNAPSTARARHSVEHPQPDGSTTSATAASRNGGSTPRSCDKPRSKDIWIPYPMISHCILRPSHAASIVAHPHADDSPDTAADNSGELFPPTFGTSSYSQGRQSTDSARLAPSTTPSRPSTPQNQNVAASSAESARQPVIRIRRKDFQMLALHFNTADDEAARQVFYILRRRCCVERIEDLHAYHFQAHKSELKDVIEYDARREYARMGISAKAADGPGSAWRISDINNDYSYSTTYPSMLCVPNSVSDNMLKYGGTFRSRSRIPCLAYLHSNGGSITRSSQPMVGVGNKRNAQDERLVSAIFSSHTPPVHSTEDSTPAGSSATTAPSSTVDVSNSDATGSNGGEPSLSTSKSDTNLSEKAAEQPAARKVYGSTRRNVIVDARPKINALANRATGGGIEDVANYSSGEVPVEKVFLNIANIHAMRTSLDKIIESLGSADYVNMKPNQDTLRKSGWLGHIAGILDGSEMVARVVGLGGSHALVHCSDGWDRTAQVSALAQIMLDPHTRTLSGFISLVQKDFLSFGHKFRHRNGIEGSEKWFEIENERIAPSRRGDGSSPDPSTFNTMGAKAFTGAKNWFEKNRGNLFRQQGTESPSEQAGSRSSSPPPNPLIHSPPTTNSHDKEHKMNEKEISPVFHQFLDAVYQLLRHAPNSFEFNERFLRRLFYHVYACQYGEFLFNSEKERVDKKLPSVWGHFLSRRQEFTNPDYQAANSDPFLFPKRKGLDRELEVRWWAELFGRKEEEMNIPQALALDPLATTPSLGSSISLSMEESEIGEGDKSGVTTPKAAIKESRSTPSLSSTVRDSLSNGFSVMGIKATRETHESPAPEVVTSPPRLNDTVLQTTTPVEDASAGEMPVTQAESVSNSSDTKAFQMDMDMDDGDPLGVSHGNAKRQDTAGRGLDFAAFASQNAFRDR